MKAISFVLAVAVFVCAAFTFNSIYEGWKEKREVRVGDTYVLLDDSPTRSPWQPRRHITNTVLAVSNGWAMVRESSAREPLLYWHSEKTIANLRSSFTFVSRAHVCTNQPSLIAPFRPRHFFATNLNGRVHEWASQDGTNWVIWEQPIQLPPRYVTNGYITNINFIIFTNSIR